MNHQNAPPLRYYELLEMAEGELEQMTPEELRGALFLATRISQFVWKEHFEHKSVLHQKTLVKTLDEVVELCMDYKARSDKRSVSDKENKGAK